MNQKLHSLLSESMSKEVGKNYRYYCPVCGKREKTLGIVNTGMYIKYQCFRGSCTTKGSIKVDRISKEGLRERLRGHTTDPAMRFKLPLDLVIPTGKQKAYLLKYRVRDDLIRRYGIQYSSTLDRIIFPTQWGWLGRSLNSDPKWYKQGNGIYKSNTAYDGRLVIVEDAISCIRVGEVCKSIALLSTGMPNYMLTKLREIRPKHITIWLDGDIAGRRGAIKLYKSLSNICKVNIVTSAEDPKEYKKEVISEYLNG